MLAYVGVSCEQNGAAISQSIVTSAGETSFLFEVPHHVLEVVSSGTVKAPLQHIPSKRLEMGKKRNLPRKKGSLIPIC